jgi:uncharacterized membrane protein YGL010W
MVPWPIALLSLGYGVIAAVSASTLWKIMMGVVDRPMVWPGAWLAVSAAAMCGLALLKPWARLLAVVGLVWVTLVTLTSAGLSALTARPEGALLATLGAGVCVVMIRYLRRPAIKALFASSDR